MSRLGSDLLPCRGSEAAPDPRADHGDTSRCPSAALILTPPPASGKEMNCRWHGGPAAKRFSDPRTRTIRDLHACPNHRGKADRVVPRLSLTDLGRNRRSNSCANGVNQSAFLKDGTSARLSRPALHRWTTEPCKQPIAIAETRHLPLIVHHSLFIIYRCFSRCSS